MVERYSNEILVVVTATEWDDTPTSSVLRLALFGGMYEDILNPSGVRQHYRGLIKSDIVFDKRIGLAFWKEDSGIDFGYLDIAVEDQDDELIDFGRNVMTATVDFYRVNLNDPDENELEILAKAQSSDIGFSNEFTIRFRLESILQYGFDGPINEKYYGYEYPQLTGKPYPIAWGLITDPYQVLPTIEVDGTQLLYHVTDIEIESFESFIYDRGIALTDQTPNDQFDPTTYGFVLNQNPDGKITCGRVLLLDPEDTGNHLHGLFRFVRLAMTRTGIWANANQYELQQLEDDIGFGDLYPQFFTMSVVSLESFLKEILAGVTGWYYVDEFAEIHFGRLTDPDVESSPTYAFTDTNTIGRIKVEDDKAPGLSGELSYAYNPGIYDPSELAGGIYGYERTEFTTKHRIVVAEGFSQLWLWTADDASWTADSITYTADGFAYQYIVNPVEFTYWTKSSTRTPIPLSIGYSDQSPTSFDLANGEVQRWWTELYYKRRRFYTFDVAINDEQFILVKPQLGDFCTLQSDRFKLLDVPKNLLIQRLKYNLSKNLLTVIGWG